MPSESQVLDAGDVESVLVSLADAIGVRNHGFDSVALVGIRTGGYELAWRLARHLASRGIVVPVGAIDIALYRDDVFEGRPRPEVGTTELPFALSGKVIVLVDDVLYTGRTVRAALDALVDYGRPRAVQLAVLVDRGHRELPIQADFVGVTIDAAPSKQVKVLIGGEAARVVVRERGDA